MDTLTALQHFRLNPNNVYTVCDEWAAAACWSAVCTILGQPEKKWSVEEIDAMIDDTNNA